MCGTFTQTKDGRVLTDAWAKKDSSQLRIKGLDLQTPVFPGNSATILCSSKQKFGQGQWGLIPPWAENPQQIQGKYYLARSEGIAESRLFADAYRRNRCLVPVSSFFEWQPTTPKKTKCEIYQSEGLWLLGIYSVWNQSHVSFSILTTEATGLLKEIHQRMPLVMDSFATGKNWLSGCDLDSVPKVNFPWQIKKEKPTEEQQTSLFS